MVILVQTISDFFLILYLPICYIALDADRFDASDRSSYSDRHSYFAVFFVLKIQNKNPSNKLVQERPDLTKWCYGFAVWIFVVVHL